jgi:hypothetical protein
VQRIRQTAKNPRLGTWGSRRMSAGIMGSPPEYATHRYELLPCAAIDRPSLETRLRRHFRRRQDVAHRRLK